MNKDQKQSKFCPSLLVKKNTIEPFLSLFLFKTVLDLSYYFVVSRVWGNAGYCLSVSIVKFIESYFLLFLMFIFMPKMTRRLSEIIIWLLVLFSYVPMLTVFALADKARIYMYATTGFWLLVFLLLNVIPRMSFNFLKKRQSKIICYSIFIFFSVAILVIIYKYLGFSFNFDINKVYEIRAKYKNINIPLAFYLFNWLSYIINPAFFAIFLKKRRWFFVVLVIFIQFILFSVTGNRIYLLILPYIYTLTRLFQSKRPFVYACLGISLIIILGMFSYWLTKDVWVTGFFSERLFISPANLSFQYYDFFSQHDFIYFSSTTIFSSFLHYPYHVDPPHLIGEVYYGPDSNANNGIVADAYMNFGFMGFILWPILLVIILKLADSCAKHKDMEIALAVMGTTVLSLVNGYLFTSLLTNGVVIGLLILYLLPMQKKLLK
jgi:hypothetical protein